MSGIVIRGCAILTMNPAREQIACGDIRVEDDRLTHVGAPLSQVPPAVDVIDGRGKVALPGFVSAHHHLYHPVIRGLCADLDFLDWIQGCAVPTSPHVEPEHLYWGARLSLAECIESGVTSLVDWAYCLHTPEHAEAVLAAIRESGVRVCFAYGPSLIGGDFDLNFRHMDEIRSRHFGGGRTAGRTMLWAGLGGPNYQPEERVREEVECVRSWNLPIHLHIAEHHSQRSAEALRILERCGATGPDLLLAHAIHLEDTDLDLLARTGTRVSYNAASNMRIGTGICRAVEMRQRGITVGLGLDSAGANDTNDYFALLRSAIGLQRARWMQADCLTVADAIDMATVEGARCLGLEREIGSLEAGKKADLILIEPRTLNFAPLNHFEAQLVFCGQPRNVDTVIVDGRVLERGGVLIGTDVEQITAKCQEAARVVAARAGVPRRPILTERT